MRRRLRKKNDLLSLASRHPRKASWSVALIVVLSVLLILACIFIRLPVKGTESLVVSIGEEVGPEKQVTLEPEEQEEQEAEEEVEEEEAAPEPEPVPEPEPEPQVVAAMLPEPGEGEPIETDQGDGEAARTEAENEARKQELIKQIRKRVKTRGGGRGMVTASLMWDDENDLDLHLFIRGRHTQPGYNQSIESHIYYEESSCLWGLLDIDANANDRSMRNEPCENIFCKTPPHIGNYVVKVQLYRRRAKGEIPYTVVVEHGGEVEVHEGVFKARARPKTSILISKFRFTHNTNYSVGSARYRGGFSK